MTKETKNRQVGIEVEQLQLHLLMIVGSVRDLLDVVMQIARRIPAQDHQAF